MVLNFHGARGGELGFPSGFSGGSNGKESAYNARDLGSIPWSGRSSGEGNGSHFRILAWRLSWTGEPGGL